MVFNYYFNCYIFIAFTVELIISQNWSSPNRDVAPSILFLSAGNISIYRLFAIHAKHRLYSRPCAEQSCMTTMACMPGTFRISSKELTSREAGVDDVSHHLYGGFVEGCCRKSQGNISLGIHSIFCRQI